MRDRKSKEKKKQQIKCFKLLKDHSISSQIHSVITEKQYGRRGLSKEVTAKKLIAKREQFSNRIKKEIRHGMEGI